LSTDNRLKGVGGERELTALVEEFRHRSAPLSQLMRHAINVANGAYYSLEKLMNSGSGTGIRLELTPWLDKVERSVLEFPNEERHLLRAEEVTLDNFPATRFSRVPSIQHRVTTNDEGIPPTMGPSRRPSADNATGRELASYEDFQSPFPCRDRAAAQRRDHRGKITQNAADCGGKHGKPSNCGGFL
jgi:hypothetical protein